MKKIIAIILCFVLMTATVTAHSTVTGYSHNSNVTGWDIYETSAHWANYYSTMTISYGDFEDTAFKNYIDSAIASWNAARFGTSRFIIMEADDSGTVIFLNKTSEEIKAKFGSSSWAVTYRTNATTDSDNHYTITSGNVEIWVDWATVSQKSTNAKTHVPLHELGHVIGLKDVPSTVSPNAYLMCNEFGASYTPPTSITSTDIKGAVVILGFHSTHSSFTYTSLNSATHRKSCSTCGCYTTEAHTYSSGSTTCSKCGYST